MAGNKGSGFGGCFTIIIIGIILFGCSLLSGWWWELWNEAPPHIPRLYYEDINNVVINDINVNSSKSTMASVFEEGSKIAVLNFRSPEDTQGGVLVSDVFATLLRKEGFYVFERNEIDRILSEQQLLEDGVVLASDLEIAEKLGNLTSVDYMVFGAVTLYESKGQTIYIPIKIREEDIDNYEEQYNIYRDWYVNKWRPWTWEYWKLTEDEKLKRLRAVDEVFSLKELNDELQKISREEFRIVATIGISLKIIDVRTGEIVWVGQAETTDFTLVDGTTRILNEFLKLITEPSNEINNLSVPDSVQKDIEISVTPQAENTPIIETRSPTPEPIPTQTLVPQFTIRPYDPQQDENTECVSCLISDWGDTKQPGHYNYNVSFPADSPALLSMGWCTTNKQILDSNWSDMQYNLEVDGYQIDLTRLAIREQEKEDRVCNTYSGVLTGWSSGRHSYIWTYHIDQPLNDGWDAYEDGDYIIDITVDISQP